MPGAPSTHAGFTLPKLFAVVLVALSALASLYLARRSASPSGIQDTELSDHDIIYPIGEEEPQPASSALLKDYLESHEHCDSCDESLEPPRCGDIQSTVRRGVLTIRKYSDVNGGTINVYARRQGKWHRVYSTWLKEKGVGWCSRRH